MCPSNEGRCVCETYAVLAFALPFVMDLHMPHDVFTMNTTADVKGVVIPARSSWRSPSSCASTPQSCWFNFGVDLQKRCQSGGPPARRFNKRAQQDIA